jgi:hypothetical protein
VPFLIVPLHPADGGSTIPRNTQDYLPDDTEEYSVIIECCLTSIFPAAYTERNTSASSLRHILSLRCHLFLDLQRGLLPSAFRPRLCTRQFLSLSYLLHDLLMFLGLVTLIIFCKGNNLRSCVLCSFSILLFLPFKVKR